MNETENQHGAAKNNAGLALLIAAVVFLLATLISPWEWDFYDGFLTHLVSGIATRNVLTEFYIFGFANLVPFYTFLQNQFSNFPWIGAVTIALSFIVNATAVFIVVTAVRKKAKPGSEKILFVIGLLLFILLQLAGIIKPSATGQSFLLCGVALLFTEKYTRHQKSRALKIILYLIALIAFWYGASIRIESAMGAGVIVGGYIALSTRSFKKSILAALPIACLCAVIVWHTLNSLQTVPFLKKTEAALFYVADGVNNNNLYEGLSPKDSIKLAAVKTFFLNDENELDETFINQLAAKKMKAEAAANTGVFARINVAWHIGRATIIAHWTYAAFNFALLFLVIAVYRKKSIRLIVYHLFFWLVVFGLAYSVKLEDRHYLYMAMLFSYGNLLLIAEYYSALLQQKKYTGVLSVVLLVLVMFETTTAYAKGLEIKEKLRRFALAEQEINRIAKGKTLMLDGDSDYIFHGSPLNLRRFESAKRIIYYDMGELALLPEYNTYLDNFCNCNSRSVVEFYRFLSANSNELVVISNQKRIDFICAYLKIVHGMQLDIEQTKGNFALEKIGEGDKLLHYYRIGNITPEIMTTNGN